MQQLSTEISNEDALSCFLDGMQLNVISVQTRDYVYPWNLSASCTQASFYAVDRGRCCIGIDASGEVHTLESGDLAILLSNIAHHVRDGFCRTDYMPRVPMSLKTTLIYGTFTWDEKEIELLLPRMTGIICIKKSSNSSIPRMIRTMRMISEESSSDQLGTRATIHHLAFSILVQGIRSQLWSAPLDRKHVVEFMDKGQIGTALYRMHTHPEEPWSLKSLARQCGMSRSAFAESFRRVVGQSPMNYLFEIRMRSASDMLSKTSLRVKEVSAHAGYNSPSAFNNAFKRSMGMAPGAYRKAWAGKHAFGQGDQF
jgi:AraC-like DNA-binding protein